MIRHFVFFTARDGVDAERLRDGLSILTDIPHARLLEVGLNQKTDPLSREVDIVVYGEFDDEAALAAYKAHPIYRQSIERVRPLREMRLAANFDAQAAVTAPRIDHEAG
ncbi:MAG: Dabb family protein [Alphaproteobacteria bacterium]|nr:Dabb family protein [Alphaproteobacteria bacterium]